MGASFTGADSGCFGGTLSRASVGFKARWRGPRGLERHPPTGPRGEGAPSRAYAAEQVERQSPELLEATLREELGKELSLKPWSACSGKRRSRPIATVDRGPRPRLRRLAARGPTFSSVTAVACGGSRPARTST